MTLLQQVSLPPILLASLLRQLAQLVLILIIQQEHLPILPSMALLEPLQVLFPKLLLLIFPQLALLAFVPAMVVDRMMVPKQPILLRYHFANYPAR